MMSALAVLASTSDAPQALAIPIKYFRNISLSLSCV
jgi:hypothetical protein